MRAPDQPDQIESQPATAIPLRVLLVEDDEDDAHLLTRYFERAGYRPSIRRVETADEMRRALDDAGAGWDVVLADFNLPGFKIDPYVLEQPVVRVWGDGAVVGGVVHLGWTQDGKHQSRVLRVAHVWAKRGDHWEATYTQLTRVPP